MLLAFSDKDFKFGFDFWHGSLRRRIQKASAFKNGKMKKTNDIKKCTCRRPKSDIVDEVIVSANDKTVANSHDCCWVGKIHHVPRV
jgi:hypothetical protein